MNKNTMFGYQVMIMLLVTGMSLPAFGEPKGFVGSPDQKEFEQRLFERGPSGRRIDCPVNRIRAEVVNRLPDPWWQTPQLGSLSDAQVSVIGGEATLICSYHAYGTQVSVMRKLPEGVSECQPRKAGFICR